MFDLSFASRIQVEGRDFRNIVVITSSLYFIITVYCSVLQSAAVCYMVLHSVTSDVVQVVISSSAHCVYFDCIIITLCCCALQYVAEGHSAGCRKRRARDIVFTKLHMLF